MNFRQYHQRLRELQQRDFSIARRKRSFECKIDQLSKNQAIASRVQQEAPKVKQ